MCSGARTSGRRRCVPLVEATLRAPTLEDVDAAVAVINAEARRLLGRDDVDPTTVRGWWTQPPPFDLARDVVLAVDGTDTVVGYGNLGDAASNGAVLWLDVRGDALEPLLAELERRANARRSPDGVIRTVVAEGDARLRALVEARGYARIRSSYRMTIDLADQPLDPCWPAGASVRTAAGSRDDVLLHDLLERAFADHWGFASTPFSEWRHWLYEMGTADPSLWFVAELDATPVGAAVCRPTEAGDPGLGWVAQLGVLPEARGRGLGTALLVHALATLRDLGRPRAGLGVDAESTTGAVRLYERVGLRVVERHDRWELRR